jgi:hypothetical protein
MITAFLEFDHSLAFVTSLPSFFFGLLEEFLGLFVSRAFLGAVPFAVAAAADLSLATTTLSALSTVRSAMDVLGLDPFAASPGRTVHSIPGRVLGVFPVPCPLEAVVEQLVDMLERDMVGRAALGRHMLGILDG